MLAKKVYPVLDVNCPVCKAGLGQRRFDQRMSFFCQDCNYFWKYEMKKRLPVGIKNEKPLMPQACGCGRCGR
jgi:transposase-like protein